MPSRSASSPTPTPSTRPAGASSTATALTAFRHIYVSSTIGLRKPNAKAYRHVADDMGFACREITFLDDNADNIAGAEAVGMQTVHVTHPAVAERFLASVHVAGDGSS
ncbi:MAG: HAD-IA family hydrolase [Gammaproteobacteria bacterium]|nr:HAD-IA family hydrolase [Gammaproteobacteria bacterium]